MGVASLLMPTRGCNPFVQIDARWNPVLIRSPFRLCTRIFWKSHSGSTCHSLLTRSAGGAALSGSMLPRISVKDSDLLHRFDDQVACNVGPDQYGGDVTSCLLVLLMILFVNGLKTVNAVMMDPYGPGLSDLSVLHYVNFTCLASRKALLAQPSAMLGEEVRRDGAGEGR